MLRPGGRVLAALYAAVRIAPASLLWPLPFRPIEQFRLARPRTRRLAAALIVGILLVPSGRLVLSRPAHSRITSTLRTVIDSSTRGVLPLDRPVAAALPPGVAVAPPERVTVVSPVKRNAVIVGINHARGSRPLQGSITDAMNVRAALLRYGFPKKNITLLTEAKATRHAILTAIDKLATNTPPSGIAVFAVASHSRIRGGESKLVAADGQLIGAHELARVLGRVRAKMWTALATCYAARYGLPGIVGRDRIATYGSSASGYTYQLGNAGSYLITSMVKRGMLEGHAPRSIEDSFEYARQSLQRTHPNRVPLISDGISGDLALGRVTWPMQVPRTDDHGSTPPDGQPFTQEANTNPAPAPTPPPTEGGRDSMVGVCGRYRYSCAR